MIARLAYPGMQVEWQDAQYQLQTGIVRYVYADGTVDVELSTGWQENIEADHLRSQVYHPEGTGKLPLKTHTVRYSQRYGPFACATCHTTLTKENAAFSQQKSGGHCRLCLSAYNKARKRRKEGGG